MDVPNAQNTRLAEVVSGQCADTHIGCAISHAVSWEGRAFPLGVGVAALAARRERLRTDAFGELHYRHEAVPTGPVPLLRVGIGLLVSDDELPACSTTEISCYEQAFEGSD